MKSKIVIRADGGTSTGMGHVIRCLALADMLKNDFHIAFAIQQPSDSTIRIIHSVTETILHLPLTDNYADDAISFLQFLDPTDIVVLDGYHFKTEYQQAVKNKGCKLAVIDDMHSWHHVADIIINHAPGANGDLYSKESYTSLFLGADYALLRKPFLETDQAKKITAIQKVFISMGAADVNNLTLKFCKALIQVKGIRELHLMLGDVNPNLKVLDEFIANNTALKIVKHFDITAEELMKLLRTCDVAICPASSISLECCSTGIGLLSGYTAENQKDILKGLSEFHAAVNLGDLNKITDGEIVSKFEEFSSDLSLLNEQMQEQEKLFDGRSPERVLGLFKNINKEELHFRSAKETDVNFYYIWANDPLVRTNSYKQEQINYEDHVKWFRAKLASPDCFFYLFLNKNDKPAGQVRIDKSGNETVIGISVDDAFRGKGLGTDMLRMATDDFLQKHPSSRIIAYIKAENTPSYNSFRNAGFDNGEMVTEQGIKSFKLYKQFHTK